MAFEERAAGSRIEIGRVSSIGHGLSSEVYAAHVELDPDPEGLSGPYVASLPAWDADSDNRSDPRGEAALLAHVAGRTQVFRVPAVTAIVPVDGGYAVVRPFLRGIPLDLRLGCQPVKPWEVVGQIAAAVHAIDISALPDLPGHPTRRAHAEAAIDRYLGGLPELREERAWALDNLPPDEPSTLLHGDLLGQNILLCPDEPPVLLDWEYAMRGDPAHDLAVVTRGVRNPFQVGGGLHKLLEAYAAAGGRHIRPAEVHLHELCMVASWYRQALEERGGEALADDRLGRLDKILDRARAASRRGAGAQGEVRPAEAGD